MGISHMHWKPQNDSEMYERVMDTGDLWKLDCEALNYVCPYLCDPNLYRFTNNSTPAPQNGSVQFQSRSQIANQFIPFFSIPSAIQLQRWALSILCGGNCAKARFSRIPKGIIAKYEQYRIHFNSVCLPACLMPFVQVKMSKTLNDHFMHSTPSLKSEKRMELWNITNH